ncbi:electron transporter [uncultured Methylobacterium sp.]|uniref:electron transporter n=1 Tax=uncultured Methylobacterium sp. TaxID=157278 RepID=UPI0026196E63|nr:electron transporter [uncultured Methylobacterium sp.]
MGIRCLLAAVACLGALPALALTRNDLAEVGLAPGPGARAPVEARFIEARDERRVTFAESLAGRPALLLPVDYACRNVCDPMLSVGAAALVASGLAPGAEFRLVTLGLAPGDESATARTMVAEQVGATGLLEATAILTGGGEAVAAVTGAIGYRFRHDPETGSYAHPAGGVVLTPDGRVARVISPLAMTARDLRLALVEAGEGRVGSLADRLVLLCYGFDPKQGVYTPLIRRILAAAGAATVAGIAVLVLVLHRRSRAAG